MAKLSKRDQELLQLGQRMQDFFNSGYVSKKQAFWYSFLKGVLSGAGGIIGGTIAISLLLWLLTSFQTVPLLNHVANNVRSTLQSRTNTK